MTSRAMVPSSRAIEISMFLGAVLSIVVLTIPEAAKAQVRGEVITYHDDMTNWKLGQIATVSVNGVTARQTTYDSRSRPIQESEFGALKRTITYSSDGTVASIGDGNGNVTTISSWKRGVPQFVRYPATPESPAGATSSAVVSDFGLIESSTDENGFTTSYQYDAMGRLARVSYPTGDTTAWNDETIWFGPVPYSEHGLAPGHWTMARRVGNRHTNTYFDALWRPVLEESLDYADIGGTLSQVVKRYDQEGKVIFQSYPKRGVDRLNESQGIHTIYDALGRVTSTSHDSELGPLISLTEYLPGFQTRVTNARGQQTQTIYQVFDHPTYNSPAGISEFGGDRHTEIYRDVFGKVTALRRRNGDATSQVWRYYVYDARQQLCKTVEPELGATIMDYDDAGNLQWTASGLHALTGTGSCDTIAGRDSGRKVARYYDARNKLKSLEFPDGRGNQSWEYWPDGLPYKITTHNDALGAGIVENTYAYNKRRMLTGESSTQVGWYTWGLGYAYDANGSLSTQSYPTGLVISYAPNALGQATQARDQTGYYYAAGASYFPNGALKQFTYGNGIAHAMAQNARQLPASVVDAGVSDLYTTFDANGNVADIYDVARGSFYNRHMQYDGLDRLTAAGSWAFGGDAWHRFTYDAVDNMKSWKLPGVKDYAEYVYNAQNQLTNIKNSGGASVVGLEYDLQGNLAHKNSQSYVFDYGNRLRIATGKEHYRYDGHGRRVLAWEVAGNNILSLYASSGHLMFEHNFRPNDQKASEHIYLAGSVIASRERSFVTDAYDVRFKHTDALGSPVAVTNHAGAVIERNDYEPYGTVIGEPNYQGIGYTGHVQDAATGLTYMQQRYYDPQVGLFLSVDPVTAYSNPVGMFNRYRYGASNPYRFSDPDGRQIWERIRQFLFPTASQLAERGERGTAGSNAVGALKQVANSGIMSASLASNPVGTLLHGAPQMHIRNNELEGAATAEFGTAVVSTIAGGGASSTARSVGAQGSRVMGDLTRAEIRAIQAVVNRAGRPLDVVGSAASGTRRGIGTNLPFGKGPGTRSDIDYTTAGSNAGNFEGLQQDLPGLAPHGVLHGTPEVGKASIRFEPKP